MRAKLALFAIVLAVITTTIGFVAGRADADDASDPKGCVDLDEAWVEVTGHEGQVYVVDSGRWVDADDHAAHTEHE